MFLSPIAFDTSVPTLIFFPMESIRVNLTAGNKMANGIPGKPPPVPTSRIALSF